MLKTGYDIIKIMNNESPALRRIHNTSMHLLTRHGRNAACRTNRIQVYSCVKLRNNPPQSDAFVCIVNPPLSLVHNTRKSLMQRAALNRTQVYSNVNSTG